jgi:SAM-dependent methyltransferase
MEARGEQGYYDLDSTREQYLAFHYPDPRADPLEALLGPRAPSLSDRYPFAVAGLAPPRPEGRALDVGAACGRVTLDLAARHREAVGVDLSRPLLAAARQVAATGRARYLAVVEGDLREPRDVPVPGATGRARFARADALRLPFRDGAFSTVTALNLLDRVSDPAQALDEAARVTAPGGTLVVGSPYTWSEEWAPRERWLGGVRGGGAEAVRARLAPAFRLVREARLPFFIPHHARSGQLGLAHVQVFARAP